MLAGLWFGIGALQLRASEAATARTVASLAQFVGEANGGGDAFMTDTLDAMSELMERASVQLAALRDDVRIAGVNLDRQLTGSAAMEVRTGCVCAYRRTVGRAGLISAHSHTRRRAQRVERSRTTRCVRVVL